MRITRPSSQNARYRRFLRLYVPSRRRMVEAMSVRQLRRLGVDRLRLADGCFGNSV